jgi:hypothetical protein
MSAKGWTSSVVWSNKDEPLLVRRVTAGLRLDDEGGRLISDVGQFGSKVDLNPGSGFVAPAVSADAGPARVLPKKSKILFAGPTRAVG